MHSIVRLSGDARAILQEVEEATGAKQKGGSVEDEFNPDPDKFSLCLGERYGAGLRKELIISVRFRIDDGPTAQGAVYVSYVFEAGRANGPAVVELFAAIGTNDWWVNLEVDNVDQGSLAGFLGLDAGKPEQPVAGGLAAVKEIIGKLELLRSVQSTGD